jgi:hypothetical protein
MGKLVLESALSGIYRWTCRADECKFKHFCPSFTPPMHADSLHPSLHLVLLTLQLTRQINTLGKICKNPSLELKDRY